ncbi:hypothetical protein COV58_01810, partial [Candidatus Roizmanbacteria bacterium CG11_big_fil_rev_8_21_14_0_20_36_8]
MSIECFSEAEMQLGGMMWSDLEALRITSGPYEFLNNQANSTRPRAKKRNRPVGYVYALEQRALSTYGSHDEKRRTMQRLSMSRKNHPPSVLRRLDAYGLVDDTRIESEVHSGFNLIKLPPNILDVFHPKTGKETLNDHVFEGLCGNPNLIHALASSLGINISGMPMYFSSLQGDAV